jgi:hypothetical protein
MSNVLKFVDIEVDGIDYGDAPDFCDAYICSATAVLEDGTTRYATEEELYELNEDSSFVYECVTEKLY